MAGDLAGGGIAAAGNAPVPAEQKSKPRIASLDFIRGIAVLGILAANIVSFGQPYSAYMYPTAFLSGHDAAADWMWVAQFVLIDGKMRGLFTLLFGAGLVLFMEKAWARGDTASLLARRLWWLLIFGLIHFYFIWRGDILTLYAVCGCFAALALRWPRGRMLGVGLAGYILGGLLLLVSLGPAPFIADGPPGDAAELSQARESLELAKDEALADDATEAVFMTNGNYADFVKHNFTAHGADPLWTLLLFALETVPLMLIGMAMYHYGMFTGAITRRKQLTLGWIAVIAGTVLTAPIALWAMATGFTYWGTMSAFMAFGPFPRLPVILGLAAILAVYGCDATGWLAERLSAAGRMAFSNYLGTSVLMLLLFHPWAGGLWGELTRAELYLVVAMTWAIMLGWSRPWLARYRHGPLEWVWRCLTYWRIFPFRK